MKSTLMKEDEETRRRRALKPVLVAEVETDEGMQIAPISPGLQHNDRHLAVHIADYEREHGEAAMDVEDLFDTTETYPPEDFDASAPVDERVLKVAGILVEFGLTDRPAMKQALTAALKHLHNKGDLGKYNQDASGRTSEALNAMAGARNGYRPAKLLYRLKYQTKWERWWKTFGHDDTVDWLRWARPGPAVRAEEVGYWILVRSVWHCKRVVNGVMTFQANPNIPADANPEEVVGSDWHVFEGLPQARIADKGSQMVKNNDDLLFTSLGHRHPKGKGGLMFGEWVDIATGSSNAQAKRKTKEEKAKDAEGKPVRFAGIKAVLSLVGTFAGIILFCVALLWLYQQIG